MIEIKHDWDSENYIDTLAAAYDEYRKACYGDRPLNGVQIRETKQAFLSGIHWLNSRSSYCPEDMESALRTVLARDNPIIKGVDSGR